MLQIRNMPLLAIAYFAISGVILAEETGKPAENRDIKVDPFDKSHLIRVPKGYVVEKVAASQLVQHPMMAGFDDRGRLFVAESAGLNLRREELEAQLPNSIKMLEDTNGDGTFDQSTLFADQMTLPMGACWYRDTLYVASPPHIWKLRDTNDDGVADVREKLPAKFGYNGNAASVHGCFLSPEGRIFWCDGRHGHELEDEQGNVTSTRSGSYIFSCRSDGSDLQVHSGGGMDNPVEVDFTETGDVLGTVNILYSSPRIDCLVHWLYGGAYPHSQRVLGELPRTGDLLGPVHQFGHVGVSGTTRYRSGLLDPSFKNNMFVTIFNTGEVVRVVLESQGSSYKSQQHEFLSCSDPDFHPTDILEDADGSLLLIDTGGWFRIGCPTSQIAKPEIKGGIYRIRKEQKSMIDDPRGLLVEWETLNNLELLSRLRDERFVVREKAIDVCALRGNSMLPALQAGVQHGDLLTRQNALWALTRMGTVEAQAIVRLGLQDRDETVRAIASKSCGVTQDAQAVPGLVENLRDTAPHVRRAALTSLGHIGDKSSVSAILKHAPRLTDRAEDHALIFALMQIQAPEETLAGLQAETAATRRVALIALDQMAPEVLSSESVMNVIAAGGPGTMKGALRVLEHHPDWDADVAVLLQRWIAGTVQIESKDASSLIETFAHSAATQKVLQRGIVDLQTDELKLAPLFQGIAASQVKRVPAEWEEDWRKAILSKNPAVSKLAIQGLTGREHPFEGELRETSTSTSATTDQRILAIEVLPAGPLSSVCFDFLIEVVENGTPNLVERAISLLGKSQLSVDQSLVVAKFLSSAGPLELQGLVKVMQHASDPDVVLHFASGLAQSRSRFTLIVPELQQLSMNWSPAAKQALQPLLDELSGLELSQMEKLSRLEPLAKVASVSRGAEVFFSEKSKCATCHRVGEKGGRIGPDLSAIGLIRRERDLLEAILFPSKSFAREYEPYSIATEDGKVFSGLIVHETAESLSIQQSTGEPLVLQRKEIETIVPAAVSVMPQGLESGINEEQLADLVAFLRSLKTPPTRSEF